MRACCDPCSSKQHTSSFSHALMPKPGRQSALTVYMNPGCNWLQCVLCKHNSTCNAHAALPHKHPQRGLVCRKHACDWLQCKRNPSKRCTGSFAHMCAQRALCTCRNHGCNRLQCVLCKHNPNKRCTGNFAHKYWVGDKLLAKCEGEIQVELVDGLTGERVVEDLSDMKVEVWDL